MSDYQILSVVEPAALPGLDLRPDLRMGCSTLTMPSIFESCSSMSCISMSMQVRPHSQQLVVAAGCFPEMHWCSKSESSEQLIKIRDFYEFVILQSLKLLKELQFFYSNEPLEAAPAPHVHTSDLSTGYGKFSANNVSPTCIKDDYTTPTTANSIHWRTTETSMEDGLLCRAAVSRTPSVTQTDHSARFTIVQDTDSTDDSSLNNALPLHTDMDGSYDKKQVPTDDTRCPSDDMQNASRDRSSEELVADMYCVAADELEETNALPAQGNNALRRRGMSSFPPPLMSLQVAGPPLQRIRSEGRFVLRKMQVDSQLLFQTIRQDGRLKFHLFRQKSA